MANKLQTWKGRRRFLKGAAAGAAPLVATPAATSQSGSQRGEPYMIDVVTQGR